MRPVWPREDMAAIAVPYNLLEKRENNF